MSSTQVVYLDEARVSIFTGKGYEGDSKLVLRPGRNVVAKSIVDRMLKDNESFKLHVEQNKITIAGDSLDITKMTVNQAMQMIALETSPKHLKELLDQEVSAPKPRKTLIDAAKVKLEQIEEAEKAPREAEVNVRAKGDGAGN